MIQSETVHITDNFSPDINHGVQDKFEVCLEDILPKCSENGPEVKMHHRPSQSCNFHNSFDLSFQLGLCTNAERKGAHLGAIMDKTLRK